MCIYSIYLQVFGCEDKCLDHIDPAKYAVYTVFITSRHTKKDQSFYVIYSVPFLSEIILTEYIYKDEDYCNCRRTPSFQTTKYDLTITIYIVQQKITVII